MDMGIISALVINNAHGIMQPASHELTYKPIVTSFLSQEH